MIGVLLRFGIVVFCFCFFVTQGVAAMLEGNSTDKKREKTLKMDDIVVTATKTEMKTHEVPAAVNVVTGEDIKLQAGSDNFYDAIRSTQGVMVMKEGFEDAVVIRGMAPSILNDGRDMNAFATHTSRMTGSMNVGMGAIERIEVIKGPQAAIHGSKAVSGVINVIRKRGDKDNPFAELRGFYGTGDELSGGLSLSGGYNNLSYFLDFSAAKQDEYETPKGKIPYMDYKRKNLYARLDYAFSDDHELSLDYTYNESKNTMGGFGYYYKPSKWDKIYSHEPEYSGLFLTYKGKFSDFFSFYGIIGKGENNFSIVYGEPNYEPDHFLNKQRTGLYKEDIWQGELRGTLNLISNNILKGILGLQYKNTDVEVSSEVLMSGIRRHSSWDALEKYWAPYAQFEFKPIPHLLLIGGVRHDNFDSDGKKMTATNPNAGLSVFPFASTDYNWSTLWVSYSEGFRTPTAANRYLPKFLGGNPDLEPEKSKGWEIGLKQRIHTWANLELNYFNTKYDELIRLEALQGPVKWKFLNVGKARYKGHELLAEIYPTEWLTLHFGLTDMDREDTENGKKFLGQPNQILQYGLSLNDFYGFSLSLWGRQYRDFKLDTGGGKSEIHPSENDIIWDAKLIYHWDVTENSVFEPFLSVENLTDQKHYNAHPYEPSPNIGIMEGRAWHVGANLRVNF